MSKYFSILFFIFLSTLIVAQEHVKCPVIRGTHPRIFFNEDMWPEIQARANGSAKEYFDALVAHVDSLTDNPVASGTGPLRRKVGAQKDGSVISLSGTGIPSIKEFGTEAAQCALVWRLTGDAKYLEKAKKLLLVSVDAYTESTANRRPVSWWSFTRINALCAYDWLYDGLTPDERERIIVPLVKHVEDVQSRSGLKIPRQPDGRKESGFYGMMSLLWYSGLAAYGDGFCDEQAYAHLVEGWTRSMEMLEYRSNSAGDDGALSTATMHYAIEKYPPAQFNFLFSVLSSTGLNLAVDYPGLALFPNWIWWSWIRDEERPSPIRTHGTGDDFHSQNKRPANEFYEYMTEYIHWFSGIDDDAVELAAVLRDFSSNKKLGELFPAIPFLVDSDHKVNQSSIDKFLNSTVKARHFESLGQFLMRSSWNPESTYCLFTSGATVKPHKHYDENNFAIYKYDHLVIDSGDRAAQNDLNLSHYYAQSVAHNVLLIHKHGELIPPHFGPMSDKPEDSFCYGGQINHTSATPIAFETNDLFTYIASDATECYGSKCSECIRQFVFIYPDYFIVYDRVGAEEASYSKDWLLHFCNEPTIKKNLIISDTGEGRIFCNSLLPRNKTIAKIGGPGKEFWVGGKNYLIYPKYVERYKKEAMESGRGPYVGAWRIEIKPIQLSKNDRFLNVLTATSKNVDKPVKAKLLQDSNRDGVSLKVNDSNLVFWFNRDGKIGGEVVINGVKIPLSTAIQKQAGIIY